MASYPRPHFVVVKAPVWPAGASPLPPGPAPPNMGDVLILDRVTNVIGRGTDSNANIILNFPIVSQRHCIVELNDAGIWEIEDNRSRNGTKVNDVPLAPDERKPLQAGDKVNIADIVLVFCPEFEAKDVPIPTTNSAESPPTRPVRQEVSAP